MMTERAVQTTQEFRFGGAVQTVNIEPQRETTTQCEEQHKREHTRTNKEQTSAYLELELDRERSPGVLVGKDDRPVFNINKQTKQTTKGPNKKHNNQQANKTHLAR